MSFYMYSDKGNVRANNEDSFLFEKYDELNILILADGMGGHEYGEVASKAATNFVMNFIKSNYKFYSDYCSLLLDAFCNANRIVYESNSKNVSEFNEIKKKMGTTLETLLIVNNKLFFAHVGDSRIYKKDKIEFKQITKDHSLVEFLFSNGAITKDEADNFKDKNSILRAIGIDEHIEVDTGSIELNSGDVLLVCSDGLTNELSNEEIEIILNEEKDSKELVDMLIDKVKSGSAKDNVTVGIFKYDEVM